MTDDKPTDLPEAAAPRGLAALSNEVASVRRDVASTLRQAREALALTAQRCRFHGDDFERTGMSGGEPRCGSCKAPYATTQAIDAIDRQLAAAPAE
jgi:hypothetical protein